MRRLLFKLLIIIVPVAAIVAASNYFIDPANLFFPREYVAGIASILLKGHNVDNIANYNERLLQEQMVTRLHYRPDVVVLGSSRIMEIGNDFFPGKTVLNAGVSHANIHDIVALAGALDSTEHLPAEVYINVDAGLISEKHTLEWQSIAPYYTYFIKKYTLPGLRKEKDDIKRADKLYALFSLEYFKESMRFLVTNGDKKFIDVEKNKPAKYGRFSDGAICYSYTYLHPDTIKTASDAAITGAKEGLSLPDQDNIQLLRTLVDFFQQHNIKVHFIMLPYHPAYYEAVNKNYNNLFIRYNAVFHAIAEEKGVELRGSFDSNVYGLNQKDFYDMHHCSKDAIKRIFNH
jgi:hypothetical protein